MPPAPLFVLAAERWIAIPAKKGGSSRVRFTKRRSWTGCRARHLSSGFRAACAEFEDDRLDSSYVTVSSIHSSHAGRGFLSFTACSPGYDIGELACKQESACRCFGDT